MSPSELISLIGSVCPKFDVNFITRISMMNPRVARGYKARVIQKLNDSLPDDFEFNVTEDFKAGNPIGAFYVDGVLNKPGVATVRNSENT